LCAAQDIAEEQFDKLSSKEIAELCQGEVFPLKVALVALDDVVLRKTLTWASEPVDKRTRCEQDSEANNQRKVEDVPIAFSDPAGNVEVRGSGRPQKQTMPKCLNICGTCSWCHAVIPTR